MAADKIIRNSKLDTFLSKLATKLTAIFWRKAETTQVSIDNTPTANSNNLVKSGGVYTAVNAKYTKPVNGIPASDIESGVIPAAVEANPTVPAGTTPTTLANLKVGSGYYSAQEIFPVTFNTTAVSDILAAVAVGKVPVCVYDNVLYVYSYVDNNQYYFTASTITLGKYLRITVSGNTETWYRGQSGLEDSGNRVNLSGNETKTNKYPNCKSVYDAIHPATESSQPAGGMLPNIRYNLGTLSGNVTIAFASPSDSSIENEYKFSFDADSTAPDITWPVSITNWVGNCLDSNGEPEIKDSLHYEVSVIGAYGIIAEF